MSPKKVERTRNTVTRRATLPGMASWGTLKLMKLTTTMAPQGT